jgi:hypothetical protein
MTKRPHISDNDYLQKLQQWFQQIQEDYRELINWCGFPEGSSLQRSAWIMMMGFVTQDSRHIARATGLDQKFVKYRCSRAKRYRVWLPGCRIYASWLKKDESDTFAAALDWMLNVMLIDGVIERDRLNRYSLTSSGLTQVVDDQPPHPLEPASQSDSVSSAQTAHSSPDSPSQDHPLPPPESSPHAEPNQILSAPS